MPEPHLPIDDVPPAASATNLPRTVPRTRWMPSLVWLVPAIAAVIGGWLALRAVFSRGPTITINFYSAEGLEAKKTFIKYKSVDIGVVNGIGLLDDRSGVKITAQMSKQVEDLLVEDARLWVVRPRVSPSGISGLGTVISGAYIAFDPGHSKKRRHDFVGLEMPPPITSDRPGSRFVLRGDDMGSLDIGSPIYLRRLQVGQVTSLALDDQGGTAKGVVLEVFVNAPFDKYVTSAARFWHASGIDLSVGPRGFNLDTQSLATILVGGIAFETPEGPPEALAQAGSEFTLFGSRKEANRNPNAPAQGHKYLLTFNQSVRGLSRGASVEMFGLNVGEVGEVSLEFDPNTAEPKTVVSFSLDTRRLRIAGQGERAERAGGPGGGRRQTQNQDSEEGRKLLERLVQKGLRGQVRTDNFITGSRLVAFDFVPGAGRAKVDWTADRVELPTGQGGGDELLDSVNRLVEKIEKVPMEQIGREAVVAVREMRTMFEQTAKLVAKVDTDLAPEVKGMLAQVKKTLGSVQQTLGAESPLQGDMRGALRDLSGAAHSLRTLSEYLERHPESLLRGKKDDRK
jgi:paraquat-inducible protein B